ncbi:RraA family protein [Alicyclobacillaceae bacterium I2511]|nr:RraA family protein [Alicyclobacillaceae bacterium I2511]
MHNSDGNKIIERYKALYTPVVCDILDQMGYRRQFLDYGLRPLDAKHRVYGFAFTMQAIESPEMPEFPYEKQFEGTDALSPGEVLVVAGAGTQTAFWGELFSTRARSQGCVGAVIDGLCRDTAKVVGMGFNVFCRGAVPSDSYGRALVTDYRVPVNCGGVTVHPGDFVMGDGDGLVVVPKDVLLEVVERAEVKALTENKVREELMAGASAQEVYKKYGVM